MLLCLACNTKSTDNKDLQLHNVATCDVWKAMSLKERRAHVKGKLNPFTQDEKQTCLANTRCCKVCKQDSHHALLCPKAVKTKANCVIQVTLVGKTGNMTTLMQTMWIMSI